MSFVNLNVPTMGPSMMMAQPQVSFMQQPMLMMPQQPQQQVDYRALIDELCEINGAEDDPNFDPQGWNKFYPGDDPFFTYDHGTTFPDQVQVVHPEDLELAQVYIGEMNGSGERHGFGVLYTADCIRRGDFRNGQFCGWGREASSQGDVLVGRFENGYLNGIGVYTNYKGNTYTGDFVDSNRTGVGEMTTGKFVYNGEFRNNRLDGKGRIQWNQGHIYEGDFKDNEINGVGVFKWKNGDMYEGQMYRGAMNGRGRYIHSNGQIYEGDYVNGIKQGAGRLTYTDGTYFEGTFVNGLPHGPGVFYDGTNATNVQFDNGRIVR